MTQKNKPGYPLPSGELGEDDIVCQLVFLPDRPEYWQAFLGAYHYLTTWLAWERDDDKRGKDAAANWREAFELTIGCWRMACLEQLQQDVSDILLALQTAQCCDGGDPTDGDHYTDSVTDGVGNVPQNVIDAGYASGSSDWTGFADYKCMVAHLVIDSMEAKLRKLSPQVDSSANVIGGFATIAIIITTIWSGGLSLLVAGLIAATGGVSALYAAMISGSALLTLADKISDNHDDLACAFYKGDSSQGSVDDLKDEIDVIFTTAEALILKNSGLEIDAKALYAGRFDQQDTAEILDGLGYEVADYECDEICDYEQYDDGDIFVQGIYGTGVQYDAPTKTWSNTSETVGGCRVMHCRFWTDSGKTAYKKARVQVTSCNASDTCGGAKHHRGYLAPLSSLVYQLDHPTLPMPSDGAIEDFYNVHYTSYTTHFKLYAE